MKILNSLSGDICNNVQNWAEKLSTLMRVEWTDKDGVCRFPYLPLTTKEYWEDVVSKQWESGEMISWISVSDSGQIASHAALIEKDGCYEGGRWVACQESPNGVLTSLCKKTVDHALSVGRKVFVEATQVHTTSQYICEKIGLNFKGISFGVNNGTGSIPLDIVHYDNFVEEEFLLQKGFIGIAHGKPVPCFGDDIEKLIEVSKILSCERGGCLPPLKFHVLPHRLEMVKKIVTGNIEYLLGK